MSRSPRAKRWTWIVTAIAVIGLVTWSAPAVADEDAYRRHMDVGIKLYEDKNYQAALVEFEAAYKETPKASPLVNRALCYKAMFQYPKAVAELRKAIEQHLDTVDKPDSVRAAIAELELLLSTVRLEVSPDDAVVRRVSLDGEVVAGFTKDASVEVGPGSHRVTVEAEGYKEGVQSFTTASGIRVQVVEVALTAEQGRVFIAANPATVELFVDRRRVGTGRWSGWLNPGTHLVELVTVGGASRYTATVAVSAGSREEIVLRPDGMLVVGAQLPVGPDGSAEPGEPPPISGFYALGEFAVYGVASEEVGNFGYAGGARVGYRFSRVVGAEIMFQQGFAGETDADLRSTRVGANVRLMTSTDVVRFVMTSGLGLAYDDLDSVTSEAEDGAGVYILLEPGLEVDLDGLILGLGTGLLGTISDTEIALVKGQFATALHVGYGFW